MTKRGSLAHRLRPSVSYGGSWVGLMWKYAGALSPEVCSACDLCVTLSPLPSQNFRRKFPWISISYWGWGPRSPVATEEATW